jgi:hypothetical protein
MNFEAGNDHFVLAFGWKLRSDLRKGVRRNASGCVRFAGLRLRLSGSGDGDRKKSAWRPRGYPVGGYRVPGGG